MGAEAVKVSVSFSLSPSFPGRAELSGVASTVGSSITQKNLVGGRCVLLYLLVFVMTHPLTLVSTGPLMWRQQNWVASSYVSAPRSLPFRTVCALPRPPQSSVACNSFPLSFPLPSLLPPLRGPALSSTPAPLLKISTSTSRRRIPPILPSGQVYSSNECDVWSFRARDRAIKGVRIVFNFDIDAKITKESVQLLLNRGTLVQVGDDLPRQLHRGQQYISVDYASLLEDEKMVQSALNVLPPELWLPLRLASSKIAAAYENAQELSGYEGTIPLDLRNIDPKLSVTRGGAFRGTAAFDPQWHASRGCEYFRRFMVLIPY